MLVHHRNGRHAAAVEAVVYPVMFLLLVGSTAGAMGVYCYQLVACMTREATRSAAVRGAADTPQSSLTA